MATSKFNFVCIRKACFKELDSLRGTLPKYLFDLSLYFRICYGFRLITGWQHSGLPGREGFCVFGTSATRGHYFVIRDLLSVYTSRMTK